MSLRWAVLPPKVDDLEMQVMPGRKREHGRGRPRGVIARLAFLLSLAAFLKTSCTLFHLAVSVTA